MRCDKKLICRFRMSWKDACVLFSLMASLVVAGPTDATIVFPIGCKYESAMEFGSSLKRDKDILKLVKEGGAVFSCNLYGIWEYEVASPIMESDGVSFFYQERIVATGNRAASGWEFATHENSTYPSKWFMRNGPSAPDDDRLAYIPAVGVSPAKFGVLYNLLDLIFSSRKDFEDAFGSNLIGRFFLYSQHYTELAESLFENDAPGQIRILAIERLEHAKCKGFRVAIAVVPYGHWSIEFEHLDGEIQFSSVRKYSFEVSEINNAR